MDILAFRKSLFSGLKRPAADKDFNNPILVKPSPFLSIRDIVARYSRGEVVYRPEEMFETPQYDDTIVHHDPVKSNLDYAQRVKEVRSYLDQLELDYGEEKAQNKSNETDVDTNIDSVSEGS